jgi:hypothetical protein
MDALMLQVDLNCFLMRIACHDVVLKDMTSYPVSVTANESMKNLWLAGF